MSNTFWKFLETISNAKKLPNVFDYLRWNMMKIVYLK